MHNQPEVIEMQDRSQKTKKHEEYQDKAKVPPQPEFFFDNMNTLEETVIESLYRDVKQILIRVRYVLIPFGRGSRQLRKWDLWGPLVLCICLAWTLSAGASPTMANEIFGTVFCLVWVGAAVVTINAKLLKGNVSFFHCVCTLGYCLFPLNIAALICVFTKKYTTFFLSAIIVSVCFLWSFKAASLYMDRLMGPKTKGLSLYPVFLFYIFLAFFTLQMSHG